MNIQEEQRGSITLETSIILPIFIFIFLFIYGLFSIVSSQNQITHALIQSTKSLSLDSYLTENVESPFEAKEKFWDGLSSLVQDLWRRSSNNENFSSADDWYTSDSGSPEIAKERFIGYLSGNEAAAREKCKNLKIVNGLDGISFETKIEEEILTVTIKYEIQYWFDFWGMGKIPMEQSIMTRLWK